MSLPTLVAPALIRALAEPLLPPELPVRWFTSHAEALALAAEAEIGWFDLFSLPETEALVRAAPQLKWVNTILAGLDAIPLDLLQERGIQLTSGRGINRGSIADYTMLGLLALAKGFPDVVRAQGRREWLFAAPGTTELEDTHALIIGYGGIGEEIGRRLAASDVRVTGVRRNPDPDRGILGSEEWRGLLSEFDWIILAAPATGATRAMMGAAEFSAMKSTARLINIGRGDLVDQPALVAALTNRTIAGAYLDVTTPEPLPPSDPLWTAPNCIISSHMAGRSQTTMFRRAAERMAANVARYLAGEPLGFSVDLAKGY